MIIKAIIDTEKNTVNATTDLVKNPKAKREKSEWNNCEWDTFSIEWIIEDLMGNDD